MKEILKNMLLILVATLCFYIVLHDLYIILILPWFESSSAGWTWFGFITFITSFYMILKIISYFVNYCDLAKNKKRF